VIAKIISFPLLTSLAGIRYLSVNELSTRDSQL